MFRDLLSKFKAIFRGKKKDEGPFVAVPENHLVVNNFIESLREFPENQPTDGEIHNDSPENGGSRRRLSLTRMKQAIKRKSTNTKARSMRRLKHMLSSTSSKDLEYNLGESSPISSQFSYKSGAQSNGTSVALGYSSVSTLKSNRFYKTSQCLSVYDLRSTLENDQTDETEDSSPVCFDSKIREVDEEFALVWNENPIQDSFGSSRTADVCSAGPKPEIIHLDEASVCASNSAANAIPEIIGSTRASECALEPTPECVADLKRELEELYKKQWRNQEELDHLMLAGLDHPYYRVVNSHRLDLELQIRVIICKLNPDQNIPAKLHKEDQKEPELPIDGQDLPDNVHKEDHKMVQNEPEPPSVNDAPTYVPRRRYKRLDHVHNTELKGFMHRSGMWRDIEMRARSMKRYTPEKQPDPFIFKVLDVLGIE
ncbi:uncharacterized protein CANTADRAFT_12401 [Suhomyces tanzawaensis NRRL Y-17324]|uniref:Uncharacterized protein n=1 Tax=Suhomyces tanzawaensis NRRL Y-17324 TaxID=984487 RepID=A0A1E4SE30_9ASCO|nr:uncharacterized protein CANTADRAFT_12401 [Suhomyces tanzawaensis NRRL Y-17324]ODV77781.1 hypothetical protein CANTADRAFT_12401 [Suhomyces tanzawaensis NRRL Y-17324]